MGSLMAIESLFNENFASKICIRLLLLFDILYKCFVDLGFNKVGILSASRFHMADDKSAKSP